MAVINVTLDGNSPTYPRRDASLPPDPPQQSLISGDVTSTVSDVLYNVRAATSSVNNYPATASFNLSLRGLSDSGLRPQPIIVAVTCPDWVATGGVINVKVEYYNPGRGSSGRNEFYYLGQTVIACTITGDIVFSDPRTEADGNYSVLATAIPANSYGPYQYGWLSSGGGLIPGETSASHRAKIDKTTAHHYTANVTAEITADNKCKVRVTKSYSFDTDDKGRIIVKGCTDPTATNYNPNATQDDGSCTYAPPPPPAVTPWLSADRSATGQAARVTTGTGGKLLLSLATNHAAQTWEDHLATFAAARPCLRYDRRSPMHQMRVSYEDAGGILTRTTENEGTNWTMPTTVTSTGKFPAFCITPTGTQHHFWVAGGQVLSCVLDPQGHVLMAAATVVASGAADDALAAWHNADTGDVFLAYRRGSGITTLRSVDGGKTFT